MEKRNPKIIRIDDYSYELPRERIAKYPLANRDSSRLIVDDGVSISSNFYEELPRLLPEHSLLVMNDTRVFHARLQFRKESGAAIEIFCLEPEGLDFQEAFSSKEATSWHVMIGNAKKWKSGDLFCSLNVEHHQLVIKAERLEANEKGNRVRLSWDNPLISFGEIVDAFGTIPIPPYLDRESEESDKDRYQTAYAKAKGSVAAPTAGLHFTNDLLKDVETAGHQLAYLTLHVGAGTFKPVVSDSIGDHHMHREYFEVSIELLRKLKDIEDQALIAVGTTSVRTLESLYWAGIEYNGERFISIDQWKPYEASTEISRQESLAKLIRGMEEKGISSIEGTTQLMITPGYQFRIVDGMLTNFHQPKSTLLLLVAAMAGEKRWKMVYNYALANDCRFLSYGDSCLFLPR